MTVRVAVGVSESFDSVEAFDDAAAQAADALGAPCDLCLVFAGAPHLARAKWILSAVHERLEPAHLIGCGAGGVVAGAREIEEGPGAVVWALSAPEATIATHHLRVEQVGRRNSRSVGLPDSDELGDAMVVLADPYSFATEALLTRLDGERPGLPVLGGLASAAVAGAGTLLRGGDVLGEGAVACSLSGVALVPCVSQGAAPVGPEMTITAAEGNVISELASRPAVERLGEVIVVARRARARAGARRRDAGDRDRPEPARIRAAATSSCARSSAPTRTRARSPPASACGSARSCACTCATPRSPTRTCARRWRASTTRSARSRRAGALLFTCNGRGSHMFSVPDHDASAVADALGAPAGGFFCAGEIGPVGGRNFLHGFTATLAVFPAE